MRHQREAADGVAVTAVIAGALSGLLLNPVGPALLATLWPSDLDPVRVEASRGGTEVDGTPFRISSLNSGFSVTGAYDGFAQLSADGLHVTITSADLATRSDLVDQNRLKGIRVGVARETATSWRVGPAAETHPVDRALEPGDAFPLAGFVAVVPGVTAGDIEEGWLVITHELEVERDGPSAYTGPATTYAHGNREFLNSLAPGT